uniref:Uncharacterized protein n=1 Tax=Rhizophora mucronata TaxID=61149 RepID=A0A2P2NNA1_RHIMU
MLLCLDSCNHHL